MKFFQFLTEIVFGFSITDTARSKKRAIKALFPLSAVGRNLRAIFGVLGAFAFGLVALLANVAKSDELKRYEFDIPQQNVESALNNLATKAGMLLLFPYDQVQPAFSNPVVGKYTVEEALFILLENTELKGGLTEGGVITISRIASKSNNKQSQDTDNSGSAIERHLEEIIVTAQKRKESSQDVPLTINTFSGDHIRDFQINNPRDLQGYTPTLVFMSQSGGLASPQVYLRGIGNESFHVNAGSPVGFYVDGSYVGNISLYGFQVMDTERVEILKGPQGTLYGRNTTAGLINYIPNSPKVDDRMSGEFNITFGRFDMLNVDGVINLPLNSQSALRIAVKSEHNDGEFKNSAPDANVDEFGGLDSTAIRGSYLNEHNDRLTTKTSLYYGNSNGSPGVMQPVGVVDPAATPVTSSTGLVPCTSSVGIGANCATVSGFVADNDLYTSQNAQLGFSDIDAVGVRFQLDYDFSGFTLTSITTYDESESEQYSDVDGTPDALLNATFETEYDAFSQEFRLTSNTDGEWSWIVGANYYTDDVVQWEAIVVDYIETLFSTGYIGRDTLQSTTSQAIFGDVTYDLNNRMTLSAGLRITNDEREGEQTRFLMSSFVVTDVIRRNDGYANFKSSVIPPTERGNDWTEWSGRLSFTYDLAKDCMIYLTLSRGFKGGELSAAPSSVSEVSLSDPEFIEAVELGFKSQLNERMRLNLAAYHYDFSEQQVFVETPTTGSTTSQQLVNAGASTIYGFELESTIIPFDNFRLDLAASYMQAEFDEFLTDPADSNGDGDYGDRSGNRLANSPETYFSVIATYDIEVANGGAFKLQLDSNYQDNRFFSTENVPALSQDGYWLTSVRASYVAPGNKWDLSIWGKNLLDEEYVIGGFNFTGLAGGFYPLRIGPRQTWGITAGYRF